MNNIPSQSSMLIKVLLLSAVALGTAMPGYPTLPAPEYTSETNYHATYGTSLISTNELPDVLTPTDKYPEIIIECACSWKNQTVAAGSSEELNFPGTPDTAYGSLSLHRNGKLVKTLAIKVSGKALTGGYDLQLPEDVTPGSGYSLEYAAETCPNLEYGAPCPKTTTRCKDFNVAPCAAATVPKTSPHAGYAKNSSLAATASSGRSFVATGNTTRTATTADASVSNKRSTTSATYNTAQTAGGVLEGSKLESSGSITTPAGILFGVAASAFAVFVL